MGSERIPERMDKITIQRHQGIMNYSLAEGVVDVSLVFHSAAVVEMQSDAMSINRGHSQATK